MSSQAATALLRNEATVEPWVLGKLFSLFRNYRLGDKYCSVVSSGLKEMKDVHEYLFSKNRLSNKGFGELLSAINP